MQNGFWGKTSENLVSPRVLKTAIRSTAASKNRSPPSEEAQAPERKGRDYS